MNCRNHPSHPARRRCFTCKIPICPECQNTLFHHIFCGQGCAELFREKRTGIPELHEQLQDLDRNVGEELREASESVADLVEQRFEKLEDSLDHALTALATMVEGSAAAVQADFTKVKGEFDTDFSTAERLAAERQTALVDKQEELRQTLGVVRGAILELKSEMDRSTARDENLLRRINSLDKSGAERALEGEKSISGHFDDQIFEIKNLQQELKEAMSVRLGEVESRWVEHQKGITQDLGRIRSEVAQTGHAVHENVANELKRLLDHVAALSDAQKVDQRSIKQELGQIRVDVAQSGQSVHEKVANELKRLLDDVAALSIAQKGNWNEVVQSARAGAESLSGEMKKELLRKLSQEVERVARDQSRGLGVAISDVHHALKAKVENRHSTFSKRIGLTSIVAIAVMGVFLPSFIFFWSQGAMAKLRMQMDDREISLKQWLDERMGSMQPTTMNVPAESILPLPAVTRGNIDRKEVAFTFDAGSNAMVAKEILDTLKAAHVHSTMFLTGQFISENPEIVKRIAMEGHEAGNHLLEHNHLIDPKKGRALLTKAALMTQLQEVERRYFALTGRQMARFWRAPYGEINAEIISWANSIGYTHVGWTRSGKKSLDTLDWVSDRKSSLYRSADKIAQQILTFEESDPEHLNGGIILMHLGTERISDFPHSKLAFLLKQVQEKGYRPVMISQLLRTETAAR